MTYANDDLIDLKFHALEVLLTSIKGGILGSWGYRQVEAVFIRIAPTVTMSIRISFNVELISAEASRVSAPALYGLTFLPFLNQV